MGIKKYGDIIEIIFSKNLMETVQFIDFYFKDNTDAWFDLKGNDNPTFNPIKQVLKMHEEKIALYERRLKEKDEMMMRLEKLISK